MGCVKESRGVGVHCCNRGCAGFMVFLGLLYTLCCLAYSLTMRLYMKAYYTSAYVAGLGVIVGLFVLSHHLFRVRTSLGCRLRTYNIVQTLLNFHFWLFSLVMGLAYTVLLTYHLSWNYDHIAAMIVSYVNSLLLFYLMVLTGGVSHGDRYNDYKLDHLPTSNGHTHSKENAGVINYYQMNLYGQTDVHAASNGDGVGGDARSRTSLVTSFSRRQKGGCYRCCRGCWIALFGLLYFLAMVILIAVFAISACHPAFLCVDTARYRDTSKMHQVTVEGHKPLYLFLDCVGNGSQTILFENGLGGLAMMYVSFIPTSLAATSRYRVCVYDRRGYGWSETLEHDNIDALIREPQWAKPNVQFMKALVAAANITSPFWYMGHSYGGHHLVYAALEHPELVSGLIFLDSADYDVVDIRNYFEVASNFQASGLLYIILELFLDLGSLLPSVDWAGMAPEVLESLEASMRTGYYLAAERREWHKIEHNWAREQLEASLMNSTVDFPILLFDKDARNSSWFPAQHFPQYQHEFHMAVPCSDHQSLALTKRFGDVVSQITDAFIMYREDKNLARFNTTKNTVLNSIGAC